MRLILVRHGQTEYNVKKLAQGWCDSPLTELGKQQARRAGELLQKENIDYIVTSDKQRTITTLVLMGLNRDDYNINTLARETHYGKFEAQPNIKKNVYLLFHPFTEYRKVGGEKMIDSLNRLNTLIQQLYNEHKDETVLAVSHGGLITNFIHYHCWKEIILKGKWFIFAKNASINILDYDGSKFKIIDLNKR